MRTHEKKFNKKKLLGLFEAFLNTLQLIFELYFKRFQTKKTDNTAFIEEEIQ